jgi:TRAP-type C4-dicarboxylate transport system permease small subunit
MTDKGKESDLSSGRLARCVSAVSYVMAAAGVCILTAMVLGELICRGLLNYSLPFAVEYSEYMVVFIGAGGAAYTLSRKGHVRVTLVSGSLPPRANHWMGLASSVLGLVFSAIIAFGTFKMALINIKTGAEVLYPTRTPVGYPQLILGVGFSMLSFQLMIELARQIKLMVSINPK